MADDLGYGDLGCYGNTAFATPNLDALAEAGVRFIDFHANAPVCSPTRAALLTGRYQQRCGIEGVVTAKNHRDTGMALEELTFAEVLRAAGYRTGLFGKWHLGYQVEFNPTQQGFDEFRGYVSGNVDYHSHIDQTGVDDWWQGVEKAPEQGYVTDLITRHAVGFIERHRNEPFCLYLPHEAPHYPYQGRADEAVRKPGAPAVVRGRLGDCRATYREMVEVLDQGVGEVVRTVKRLGLERRTFIFFCSDNGATPQGSNAPLNGHKGSLWEGGHRVPAMACWPGRLRPGTVSHDTAMTMDLFPTLAAVAGVPIPGDVHPDGVNLLPALEHGDRLLERTLFWRFGAQKAVRRGPWKLLVAPREARGRGRDSKPQARLYHLGRDLGEQRDLSRVDPERVRQLRTELDAWETQVSASVDRRT